MDLPDLNLWFALLVPEHPFHPEAQRYWGVAAEPVLVRVTALGLLRLLTNPKAMGGKPLEVGCLPGATGPRGRSRGGGA
ncbi:hypothetical protein [Thermus sp. NEB1569]|uniref:hypothetical protein n=1 Tax=Thermus sp. NEB1569 TaxID=2918899 RepID=UPI001EFBBDFC|nr:hypothetical protein [Thermus sp. NEB1569]ULR40530.1 hypothetical protein MI302_10580 [Thermus sp. NEB1569]